MEQRPRYTTTQILVTAAAAVVLIAGLRAAQRLVIPFLLAMFLAIIAAIPAVLFALAQLGPGRAVLLAAGYLIVNLVLGNIVEPQLIGRTLGLSSLVVFLSLVFWGWVWGPVGMLLSVPLTMIIKIMLESTEDFRWFAIMLDSGRAAQARLKENPPVEGPGR